MSTSASLVDIVRREMKGLVSLSADQEAQLERHYQLLLLWNRKMSLTTVTSLPEAAVRHYCESLFLATYLGGGASVIDVGSGAGFPGFPVAVLHSDCLVDLCESNTRKCVFLREASRGMTNVRVLADRAESVKGGYEWLISRAVSPRDLLKLNLASKFVLLVGADDAAQIKGEIRQLPWGKHRVMVTGVFHVER